MSEKLDRYSPDELDSEVEVCLGFEVEELEQEIERLRRLLDIARNSDD